MKFKTLLKPLIYLVIGVSVAGTLVSVATIGYSRLSDETLVAELTFDRLVNGAHIAQLTTVESCQTKQHYPIYGDQWRIDARFLKWKPWANLVGLDASYRLDRLSGRYTNILEQNRGPHQAHNLAFENLLDISLIDEYGGESSPLLDTLFGSSVYQNIDTQQRFLVYRSQTGLFTRSVARDESVGTQIRPSAELIIACNQQVGYWSALFNGIFNAVSGAFE